MTSAHVGNLLQVGHSVTFNRTIVEADVALFASLSGDRNPLHLSEEFARTTRFGGRLVHGAFLVGLISAALTELTGPGYVYLGQDIRFRGPVLIGDTVTVRAEITKLREDKPILFIETTVAKVDGDVALSGSAGLMKLETAPPL